MPATGRRCKGASRCKGLQKTNSRFLQALDICRIVSLYSLRSASIGFRFAALTDGRSPNTIQIIMENATEKRIAGTLIATGVFDILEIT